MFHKPTKRKTGAKVKVPQTRGAKGAGTVFYSRARKCWVARKPIGRRNGKTVYLERTGKTQAEAIRRRDAASPPGPDTTVGAWADRWLTTLDMKPQSKDDYANAVRLRIRPALGHHKLVSLTPFDVEEAARAWGRSACASPAISPWR